MDSKKRAREEEAQNSLLDPTFLLREQHKALTINLARYKARIGSLEEDAARAAATSASLQDVLSLLCRQLSAVRGAPAPLHRPLLSTSPTLTLPPSRPRRPRPSVGGEAQSVLHVSWPWSWTWSWYRPSATTHSNSSAATWFQPVAGLLFTMHNVFLYTCTSSIL